MAVALAEPSSPSAWSRVAAARAEPSAPRLQVLCLCSELEYRQLVRALREQREGRDVEPVRLSAPQDMARALTAAGGQVVVLGHREQCDREARRWAAVLRGAGIPVQQARAVTGQLGQRPVLELLQPGPADGSGSRSRGGTYRLASSALDLAAGLVALLLLLVVGPLVAVAVTLTSPGPVLYRQARVGLHGKPFQIVKFRTMVVDAEAGGARCTRLGDDRVTRVGSFLRRSRLDELPQAWNLLRREMALIGPRPERPVFSEVYALALPRYRQRLTLRPGLTGWAQVTEGYTDDLAGAVRKLERDLYYIEHRGLRLDLVILARTVLTVVRMSGR